MKGIITIVVLITIVTFPSCFPRPLTPTNLEDLPSFTTTGRNTFGCILNGETMYNEYEEDITAWYDGNLNISARTGSIDLNMLIPIYDRRTFNLVIDDSDTVNTASITTYDQFCAHQFGKNGKQGNVLNLHIRRFDRNVVAGTFSMIASDTCGNIDLKQGRFDINFRGSN